PRRGGVQAVRRVVVVRVVAVRADVPHVVSERGQLRDQLHLQLVTGMVTSQVDTHVRSVAGQSSSASTNPARAFGTNQVLLRGIFCRARLTATKSSTLTGAISTASCARPRSTCSCSHATG